MKNIKKIKSYGKAVAGSALLIGATLAGGAAFATAQSSGSSGSSYTLGDFPTPFVGEDGNVQSTVVVGENAKTVDVVGAVNIAGSLGNAAFAEETVEGATPDVNGLEFTEAIRGTDNPSDTMDASDYDTLTRESVEDSDGVDHFVVEQASYNPGTSASAISNSVNNESEVLTSLETGAVEYSVTYTPGFAEGEEVNVLGENYEITDIRTGPTEVDLGSTMEQAEMAVGDSFDHGPYTVSITDADQDGGEVYVQVAEGETVLKSAALDDTGGASSQLSVNDGELVITADQIFFGTEDHITLSSTYTDTTVEAGEASPFDEAYDASITLNGANDAVEGFTLTSQTSTTSNPEETDNEFDREPLTAGEAVQGPQDYFSLTYQGLSDEATSGVTVKDGYEVTYNDALGVQHTLDMDSYAGLGNPTSEITSAGVYYVDIAGHPVKVDVTDVGEAGTATSDTTWVAGTVSYETFSEDFNATITEDDADSVSDAIDVSTGYGFNVNLDAVDADAVSPAPSGGESDDTTGAAEKAFRISSTSTVTGPAQFSTELGADIHVDETGQQVAIDEDDDNSLEDTEIAVEFDTSSTPQIQRVEDTPQTTDAGSEDTTDWSLTSENTETRSNFGSVVEVGSGMSSVTATVPEAQLDVEYAFGEVGEATGDQTTSTPTGWPDAAALDSDVDSATRTGDNLILVGGPLVNNLTAELADEDLTWNSSQYEDNQGVGVLDLVNDAFVDGKSALVVAGWQGEDTRRAANFIADYEQNADALADKSTVQINTASGEVVQ